MPAGTACAGCGRRERRDCGRLARVPRGIARAGPATGHKCAGYEFAPLLLQVFLVELYRAHDVVLREGQDLGYDWTKVPPEPKGGLLATVRPRA